MARPSARRPAKRSPREWALRGGLAAAALVLGYVSTTQTLAFAIGKTNAERSHSLAPRDGRLTGELAEQLAARKANSARRARTERLAHQALADEPLAVPAITALALNAQIAGDTGRARALFVHSDTLSRRELGTRLWLIEDAVTREDVPAALRHYDIALRTAKGAPELLFPVLSQAIADPAIADALADTLASRPPWSEGFVGHLSAMSAAPTVSARFLQRLANSGIPIAEGAQANVVNALVAAGALDDGWAYYASLRKQVNRNRSRDPQFAEQPETPTAFDWTPMTSDAGINASIQNIRGGGIFDFAAPSTVGGVVLQQTQLLSPGRYRLAGVSAGINQTQGSRPYWQLTCSDGREAGRVDLSNSSEDGGRFAGEITIGADCAAQMLRLVVRPSSEVGGVAGQIERVLLAPIGRNQ